MFFGGGVPVPARSAWSVLSSLLQSVACVGRRVPRRQCRPRLWYGPCRALGDSAQRLAQVPGATDKRSCEGVLVNMVSLVCRGQNLALIDEVDPDLLQNLRLSKSARFALSPSPEWRLRG